MPSTQQRDEGDTGAARRGPTPLVCEMFQGINTTTTRPGVPDQQMYWCDGWMPIAPRKLRTMYGIGPPLYTNPAGISCYFFYNLAATPYCAVFNEDGSVVQVNTATGATTQILATGTIVSPVLTQLGVTQYGSQYLIIVAQQTNGYWIWDGTTVFTAGTLAPGVTLTNVGSGYTSPPIVTATGGHGSGATFVASITPGGGVNNVTMTNPGTGYQVGDVVTLNFTGGNQAGSGAVLTPVMQTIPGGTGATFTTKWQQGGFFNGQPTYNLQTVTITNGGSGYSSQTQVIVTGGQVAEGSAALTATITGGVITAVTVVQSGTYYHQGNVTATDNGFTQIQSVTVNNGGSLYSSSPVVQVTGGQNPPHGTATQAVLALSISGGVIVSCTVTSGGIYGGSSPLPTITVTDTAVPAAGTVSLMPFGVQGNAVQTYNGHVWVINGKVVQFTAPGSVSDFATSDGGGTFTSSDNFLRVGYTAAIQTNGFLFLIGDSSMNYISGVQTSTPQGGNPTTTFTNNNSDPEIGTPYPATVTTFDQDIFLANSTGVFVSSGGVFEKKSTPLDGVFNSVPNFNGAQLSSAKATIFGQRVWMILVPIIDPVNLAFENELFLFNGQFWWSTSQDVILTYVAGQEINSVFTAWGTDGESIFPLFAQPTTAFLKLMQTRLWDAPAGYDHTKSSVRLFAMAQFFGTKNLKYSIYIDNENGMGGLGYGGNNTVYVGLPAVAQWFNGSGVAVSWSGTSGPATWFLAGPNAQAVMAPTAIGQMGVLTGMTTTTMCDDMVLISEMMQDEIVQYRG